MKIKFLAFAISILIGSCTNNNGENKTVPATVTDVPKTEAADVKGTIKVIAGKYYVPTDNAKSDLILTINQNLNLQLLNYNGNYEGKIIGGRIQFDDSKATTIEFALKDSLLVLKNENDVTIEFRE